MARPKEFDKNRVLDKAMEVFWCRGYEATTMQDLVEAMEINRQSIYDTFGDKHALFLAAFDHYEAIVVNDFLTSLDRPGPVRPAIEGLFEAIVQGSPGDRQRGCMISNLTVELAGRDETVAAKIANNFEVMVAGFYKALVRAQAQGEINTTLDLHSVAHYFFSTFQGLRVSAKATTDQQVLQNVVEVALSVLG